MSQLAKGRQQLAQVKTLLRQDKLQSAIEALYSGLVIMVKANLLKSEQAQFAELLAEALEALMRDDTIKEVFPLNITYESGKEHDLLTTIEELRITFNEYTQEQVGAHIRELEARKKSMLADAEAELEAGNKQISMPIYEELRKMFSNDPSVYAIIGQTLLKYNEYDDAVRYLEMAIEQNPALVSVYNDIGMALRKLKRFDLSEQYYIKAAHVIGKSPNLFFNLGRVYVDAENWPKALKVAQAALEMQPDFVEAQRMQTYVLKKIDEANVI